MTATRLKRIQLGPFTVGEIPQQLEVTFQDVNGTALDISGFTAFDFVIEVADGKSTGGLGAGTAALKTDGTDGIVKYPWVAADFLTAGHFKAQMWIGNGGTNRLASDLFEWFVEEGTTNPGI